MNTLSIRDSFKCVVLDRENMNELHLYFEGRKIHYEDLNNWEADLNRNSILEAHRKEGADYYSLNFEDANQAHFILMNAEDGVLGSAELSIYQEQAVFSSGHISSKYWGRHLADLLYQAREKYLTSETNCKKAILETKHNNFGSQKAALRNGFHCTGTIRSNLLLFEKDIG